MILEVNKAKETAESSVMPSRTLRSNNCMHARTQTLRRARKHRFSHFLLLGQPTHRVQYSRRTCLSTSGYHLAATSWCDLILFRKTACPIGCLLMSGVNWNPTSTPQSVIVSTVCVPMCGTPTTFGRSNSSCGTWGSCSYTSKPAALTLPDFRASIERQS